MIKLNIRKNNKSTVKSFITKRALTHDLQFILDFPLHWNDRETLSEKLWDLNVGTTYDIFGFKFAMAGKSRDGNIMYGGQ